MDDNARLRAQLETMECAVSDFNNTGDTEEETCNTSIDEVHENPYLSEDTAIADTMRSIEKLICPFFGRCSTGMSSACPGPAFNESRIRSECQIDLTGHGAQGRMSRACSTHSLYLCLECAYNLYTQKLRERLLRPD